MINLPFLKPQKEDDGSYSPSSLALKMATSSTTDYTPVFKNHGPIRGKILMLCTEEKNLEMQNGKYFSTGNHPVEMLVPILHLQDAGFEIEVFTLTGKAVKLEMWAFPEKDEAVHQIFEEFKPKFHSPHSLAELVSQDSFQLNAFAAVFIPGGHGALMGLPQSTDVKKLIYRAHENNLLMLSICHGPAAFISAAIDEPEGEFIYRGYKIAAFPDGVDSVTPWMGYMPGHLKWKFGKRLKGLGMEIVNKMADKSCHRDRNLITAASPLAANDFGQMAAKALIERIEQI